jgi:membrane dipeptidase
VLLIVDGHEDLAYNVLMDGRNYLVSAHATRADEDGGPIPDVNGLCMLGLPEWLRGGVAVVFATLLAIPRALSNHGEAGYPNPEAAYQLAIAQLNIYRAWATTHPQISLITHRPDLDRVLASWSTPSTAPDRREVGLVLLIENADVIRTLDEVDFWYQQGVRLIGPAWHTNRFTGSTMDSGPLTALGRELLAAMGRLGMILDLTHMSDEACAEALDRYDGTIVATHANPRRLVPMHRLLSDETIAGVIAHDGVVGIMPANWALDPAWKQPMTKSDIPVDAVVDAIDVVCQLAGDARHVGIGTDFDGGFGAEATPDGLDTVADLPLVADALTRRGYSLDSVEAIMGGNWLRLLRRHLPCDRP